MAAADRPAANPVLFLVEGETRPWATTSERAWRHYHEAIVALNSAIALHDHEIDHEDGIALVADLMRLVSSLEAHARQLQRVERGRDLSAAEQAERWVRFERDRRRHVWAARVHRPAPRARERGGCSPTRRRGSRRTTSASRTGPGDDGDGEPEPPSRGSHDLTRGRAALA